jgi:hypothetical protein
MFFGRLKKAGRYAPLGGGPWTQTTNNISLNESAD